MFYAEIKPLYNGDHDVDDMAYEGILRIIRNRRVLTFSLIILDNLHEN